jgi:V/A-type H+/Na+-transporting ATPase subunit D
MAAAVRRATTAAGVADGFHGRLQLGPALADSQGGATVRASTRNLAGARVPQLRLVLPERRLPPYDLVLSSSMVDDAADAGREALPAIIVLAELDRTLELLGMEIQRTKRISNALEYVVVPALERTIRALSMKFEERDREEKARLKHIKVLRSPATAASC